MVITRRAELTSKEVITTTVAIVGFLVVALFLFIVLDIGQGEDLTEACRLSVLARATAPSVAQASVPLSCTTAKFCISPTGSKTACPQFLGEEYVIGIKLDGKTDDDNAGIIERVSAEAMYQCWSMMGKGQLDLFGNAEEQFFGSEGKATCVICSRVAYANIPDSVMAQVNLEDYLENALVPGSKPSITYLQAFTDREVKSFASLQTAKPDAPIVLPTDATLVSGRTQGGPQIAFVFSQVKAVSPVDVLSNLGYAAVGSTFVLSKTPFVGRAAGGIISSAKGFGLTTLIAGVVAGGAAWNAYEGQRAAAGYCGSLTTASEDLREGCSLVQAVNYNVQDINALCPTIQGNP